jgi:hypothetical protein
LTIVALPALVEFGSNARANLPLCSGARATVSCRPHCGSAWFSPLFYHFVVSPWLYLPLLASAASLVALLAAGLIWRATGRSAHPERTS